MNPHLIRDQKEQALYEQTKSRTDYEYTHSDVVTSRTAYKDNIYKSQKNVMYAHILGGIVAGVTRQRIRNFFLTSFSSFAVLNYFNDSNCRIIIEKGAQNNIERLNVMMDLK